MSKDLGRVPDGTGLSQAEPQEGLGPTGFDPSRIMREFYCSIYYEPKARPADNVQAAIEFALDRYAAPEIERLQGKVGFWMRNSDRNADQARINHDCYLRLWADHGGPELPPRLRDSDGSPKGGDGEAGSVHDSAGPKGIAQTPSGSVS